MFKYSSKPAISALLNGFVSEIEIKQKSQCLIGEILAFGKEPFIATESLTPIKKMKKNYS